ncbi:PREDICTED: uncharacterized protein LOC106146374 [Chinchilla lanigera]|uniref:uncharacterized protein LOC106146374 n=1 Tax=Chinchilla lanigera TaxID=34839 RepID=UPI0006986EF7|nr:PREDICTED: uncharacterized protein LOC106146374 [Chinchilla lanigera]
MASSRTQNNHRIAPQGKKGPQQSWDGGQWTWLCPGKTPSAKTSGKVMATEGEWTHCHPLLQESTGLGRTSRGQGPHPPGRSTQHSPMDSPDPDPHRVRQSLKAGGRVWCKHGHTSRPCVQGRVATRGLDTGSVARSEGKPRGMRALKRYKYDRKDRSPCKPFRALPSVPRLLPWLLPPSAAAPESSFLSVTTRSDQKCGRCPCPAPSKGKAAHKSRTPWPHPPVTRPGTVRLPALLQSQNDHERSTF